MDLLSFLFIILFGSSVSSNKVQGLRAEEINGGYLARSSMFKYVVALMYKIPGIPEQNPCTASILSNWYIATVAHCFIDKKLGVVRHAHFYIIAGTQHLMERYSWTKIISVNKVFIPKIYWPGEPTGYSSIGNLALAKLNKSLEIQTDERGISQLMLRPRDHRNVKIKYFVVGFGLQTVDIILREVHGKTEYVQTGKADGSLTYARGYILSDVDCRSKLQSDIAPGNMCVKLVRNKYNMPVGICEGDSGAPLVDRSYLDGIAIRGFMSCDEEELPGIYLDTFYYRPFIETVLADRRTNGMYEFELEQTPEGVYQFNVI